MATIIEKTNALIGAYGSQENLNYILKVIGNEIAHSILQEIRPIPPLKIKIEVGKTQLILDKLDENYLLSLSKHTKRTSIAQRSIQNDSTLQDITYRLLIAKKDVDLDSSEAALKTYLEDLVNEIAQVTNEELMAIIPVDQTI